MPYNEDFKLTTTLSRGKPTEQILKSAKFELGP